MTSEDLFREADAAETVSRLAWAKFHASQPSNTIRTVTTATGRIAFVKNKDGVVTRLPIHEDLDTRGQK